MKKTFKQAIHLILLALVFANLLACANGRSNENQTEESDFMVDTSAFSPIVQHIIGKYDDYLMHDGGHRPDSRLYDIHIYKDMGDPILTIGRDIYYNKDRIVGYSYWNTHTIAYYEDCPECNLEFVDKSRLIPFTDSVPGYEDRSVDIGTVFDPVIQKYLIHGPDSLELIYSGSF